VTRLRRRIVAAAIAVLVLAAGVGVAVLLGVDLDFDFDRDDNAKKPHALGPPARLTVKDGLSVLVLTTAEQKNGGIETARLATAPAQETLTGYGTILDAVPLSELNHRYLDAESAVQTATARLAVSRAAFERARTLYSDRQNVSAAQMQAAEGSFEVDKAALTAARAQLASVAASARQNWGGVIGASLVDRTPLLERLLERRQYLVKVTLPPGAVIAAPPESAAARLLGGGEVALALVSPATATDPRLQGLSYFYAVPAESGLLPGINLQVSLPAEARERGLAVPEAAVVWLQGKAWVYLRTDPTTFLRRDIAADRAAADGGYIVTGLPADAEIVVRGAQMLLSEEFRSQVPIQD
jgi:hypothetical protein